MGLNNNFVSLTVDILEREGFPRAKDASEGAELQMSLQDARDRARSLSASTEWYITQSPELQGVIDQLNRASVEYMRESVDRLFQTRPFYEGLRARREYDGGLDIRTGGMRNVRSDLLNAFDIECPEEW